MQLYQLDWAPLRVNPRELSYLADDTPQVLLTFTADTFHLTRTTVQEHRYRAQQVRRRVGFPPRCRQYRFGRRIRDIWDKGKPR